MNSGVAHEEARVFTIDGMPVTETIIHWRGGSGISVDYVVGDDHLYADRAALTSYDAPLSDGQLREQIAKQLAT
jgi:hypothetical protein